MGLGERDLLFRFHLILKILPLIVLGEDKTEAETHRVDQKDDFKNIDNDEVD